MYACKIESTAQEDRRNMAVLEKKLLGKIIEFKRNDEAQIYEIGSNEKIQNLFCDPDSSSNPT